MMYCVGKASGSLERRMMRLLNGKDGADSYGRFLAILVVPSAIWRNSIGIECSGCQYSVRGALGAYVNAIIIPRWICIVHVTVLHNAQCTMRNGLCTARS
jgi:hypothetical protein